ncbi:MAG: hypothetical protein Q9M43_11285 [Sulfurimonas sp.]|nr:hypothetical protein [Sulfurimonas sp.]
MSKNYSKYVEFLASKYNILYIGKQSERIYDETSTYFLSASKIDMLDTMLDKLDTVLMKRHINIIVIDATANTTLVEKYYKHIMKFDEEMLTLLLYEPTKYHTVFDIAAGVDAVITYPINKDIFHKKLFTVLSRSYAMNSIGRREIIVKTKLCL